LEIKSKYICKAILLLLQIHCFVVLMNHTNVLGQVYTEKRTKHRFAQLNFGFDYQTNFGGEIEFLNENGNRESLNLKSLHRPRLLLGGTHFWGHVDLYIAIPLYAQTLTERNQEILYLNGVETVLKYYPYRIENNKIRPFIGLSLAPYYYEQNNPNFAFKDSPELNHTSIPILAGFTFNSKNSLFEVGLQWNYNNQQEYYISREDIATINTPPLYANFSYRYLLDTTLREEEDWGVWQNTKDYRHTG